MDSVILEYGSRSFFLMGQPEFLTPLRNSKSISSKGRDHPPQWFEVPQNNEALQLLSLGNHHLLLALRSYLVILQSRRSRRPQ